MPQSLEDLTPGQLLDHARAMQQRTALFDPLMQDPDTRGEVLRVMRKKFPNMPIPELDAQHAAEKLVATEREERVKLEAKLQEESIERRLSEQRTQVKAKHGLTDADLSEVEKIMTDKDAPVPNWEGAVRVFKASRVQATPTPATLEPRVYDMPAKETWAGGIGNKARLDKIAMKEATSAANDIISGRVKFA